MLLSIPCKAGKIQISEDGTIQVAQVFGKVLWQARCQDVTGLVTQPGAMMAVNVTIQAMSGPYMAEMVTKANFAKLAALFPNIQGQQAGSEWYHSPSALTHVAVYTNQKDMQREVEAAGQFGWIPQGAAATASHINVGRTVAKAVVFSPLSLVTGASRSKEKTTITFVRSPEWMARRQ